MSGPWQKLVHRLTDTHCHIQHYKDPIAITSKINELGLRVHCVTVKPSEFQECKALIGNSQNIIPSLGLFPLNVKEEVQNLPIFFKLLKETRFVGEVGLDYTVEDTQELALQQEVFKNILAACHKQGNKVLSVHSRKSGEDVLKLIGDDFNGTAIMHWFSGHVELAKRSAENVYYSINTAMLKSRQGKKVIRSLRPEQILTETDGPYVKINNKAAFPSDIKNVVNSLASLWDKSLEETVIILEENYRRATKEK